MRKIKYIKRQDSGFKLSYGHSGETSLNLSNEIFDFISQGSLNPGEEKDITFRIYKEDCIKAMSFIIMKLPLYKSSSNYSSKVDNCLNTFGELYSKIETFFGNNKKTEYTVSLFYRVDGRIYLKGLRVNGFSIRDYLVENYSALQFDDEDDVGVNLHILSDIEDNGVIEDEEEILFDNDIIIPFQQIYYGAPGTGKSNTVKKQTAEAEKEGRVFRTTFHPDSDYSTFVGCYKPSVKPTGVTLASGEKEEVITYKFVPQAFTKAYIKAWGTTEKVYLIIEEINRGNCAQIFGDLFQLLDRGDDGFSEYPIDADSDLANLICKELENSNRDDLPDGVKEGKKLVLPSNLYIWATMNTSDQSLFPIDSAFKRRWEWVYMPIDTKKENWYIKVGENRYSWTAFLEEINNNILTDETAEDKHLGFYFCKAENGEITQKTFVGKVLFYLWNDVFKVYGIPSQIGNSKEWAYTKFYNPDGKVNEQKVAGLMVKLKIAPEGNSENMADDQ